MKIVIPLFFFLLTIISCTAQDYSLNARIKNGKLGKCYLAGFKDGKTELLDSITPTGEDIVFVMKKSYKPGVYRIILGQKNEEGFYNPSPAHFDFIFNSENIRLEADHNKLVGTMKVLSSKENEVFYAFLNKLYPYKDKFFLLGSLLDQYSQSDPFYAALSDEFINVQQNYSKDCSDLMQKYPKSLSASVLQSNLTPIIQPSIRGVHLKNFYKEHYFDLTSFADERLINSQVYTGKILEFLGFYGDPGLSSEEQESEYIKAVDIIMDKASINPRVYDFVLNYLIDGFDELKMEKVLVHLGENYVEGGCETDSKKLMEKRLEGYKKMAAGKNAPDIIMLDNKGKQVRLYDLKNEYVLVLFWASWCPHCTKMLPQIKKWYVSRPLDLEIFSVSIDTSRFEWEEALMMNNYPWINTCTFAGWDGKAAKDYNIYATPTMFLLDRERKIIAKPLTYREFKREIDKL